MLHHQHACLCAIFLQGLTEVYTARIGRPAAACNEAHHRYHCQNEHVGNAVKGTAGSRRGSSSSKYSSRKHHAQHGLALSGEHSAPSPLTNLWSELALGLPCCGGGHHVGLTEGSSQQGLHAAVGGQVACRVFGGEARAVAAGVVHPARDDRRP